MDSYTSIITSGRMCVFFFYLHLQFLLSPLFFTPRGPHWPRDPRGLRYQCQPFQRRARGKYWKVSGCKLDKFKSMKRINTLFCIHSRCGTFSVCGNLQRHKRATDKSDFGFVFLQSKDYSAVETPGSIRKT